MRPGAAWLPRRPRRAMTGSEVLAGPPRGRSLLAGARASDGPPRGRSGRSPGLGNSEPLGAGLGLDEVEAAPGDPLQGDGRPVHLLGRDRRRLVDQVLAARVQRPGVPEPEFRVHRRPDADQLGCLVAAYYSAHRIGRLHVQVDGQPADGTHLGDLAEREIRWDVDRRRAELLEQLEAQRVRWSQYRRDFPDD